MSEVTDNLSYSIDWSMAPTEIGFEMKQLITSPEFLLTASYRLVVWRYELDFTRQKSGYYGPALSRPRDE